MLRTILIVDIQTHRYTLFNTDKFLIREKHGNKGKSKRKHKIVFFAQRKRENVLKL